jgi:uroporphyrinogen decarboxylase
MKQGFNGLKVTSFESRRCEEMKKLISYHGGVPRVAPSMREVPDLRSPYVDRFAEDLFSGNVDILVLMTGVGTRILSDMVIAESEEKKYIDALRETTILARGPKPVAALRKLGIRPDITVPEPNTWRDILTTFDRRDMSLENLVVYVQEYGVSNEEFLASLEKRGADVRRIPIYRWALPEDLGPLQDAVRSISEGTEDCLLFTSSRQVSNLFEVAGKEECGAGFMEGIKKALVCSIGPTTTETLRENGISVDYEPDSPKMGNLVREVARRSAALLAKKRTAFQNGVDTQNWNRTQMVWSGDGAQDRRREITSSGAFMKACRLEKADHTPIWLMRQAGRFLREYREARSRVSFKEFCKTPDMASEITLMVVDRFGVDAAIIFSDILLILEPLGLSLEYSSVDGPVIAKPLRTRRRIEALRDFDPESMSFVYEALRTTRRALAPEVSLIGFSGAPFTVASYAVEGSGSKNYVNTKKLMYGDPSLWERLMEVLTASISDYLCAQIDAGADAVQIFDSWVGCLSPADYERFVFPHVKKLISALPPDVPVILFGTATGSLLELMGKTGAGVIGLDWRVDILDGWRRAGSSLAVQGNLDPVSMLSTPSHVVGEARKILDRVGGMPGHIFNLGHGVLPQTPVDNVLRLIDEVHEYSARGEV